MEEKSPALSTGCWCLKELKKNHKQMKKETGNVNLQEKQSLLSLKALRVPNGPCQPHLLNKF